MPENRSKTGRTAPRTAFLPGKSGNPGGRPRKTEEEFALVKACQNKTPKALAEIERLMTQAKMEKVRLGAAIFIIERGFGKAVVRSEEQGSPLQTAATGMLLSLLADLKAKQDALVIQHEPGS